MSHLVLTISVSILFFNCQIYWDNSVLFLYLTFLNSFVWFQKHSLKVVSETQQKAFDLWQQLELASELESGLQDTVDWGRKLLGDFSAVKTHLMSFDWSNNIIAIVVKMCGFVLKEKSSSKMLGFSFSSKLNWVLTLYLLLKLPPRNLEPRFVVLCSFFLLKLLCISTNLSCRLSWNTVAMSGWCS